MISKKLIRNTILKVLNEDSGYGLSVKAHLKADEYEELPDDRYKTVEQFVDAINEMIFSGTREKYPWINIHEAIHDIEHVVNIFKKNIK